VASNFDPLAFQLEEVVPWGRSFEEYERMFALSPGDLLGHILGCADGPASFNAEAHLKRLNVVSCDPLYRYSRAAIQQRIEATFDTVLTQTRKHKETFVWSDFSTVEDLGQARNRAMRTFLNDYDAGLEEGRYVEGALPRLPFQSVSFDLALCSHFLFLYSVRFTESFHFAAVQELKRVAAEVRIFPLLSLDGGPSKHVRPLFTRLKQLGLRVSIERVPYEFQRGGNRMLCIRG
jgi:hypothetical protein